jgi:hypothetical protein
MYCYHAPQVSTNVTQCELTLVTDCTRVRMVVGPNPAEVKSLSFLEAAILSSYIAQIITVSSRIFRRSITICHEQGCAVSIVSAYGRDERAIWIRSPAEAKNVSSRLRVQTGSVAHPASCPLGNGDLFVGG